MSEPEPPDDVSLSLDEALEMPAVLEDVRIEPNWKSLAPLSHRRGVVALTGRAHQQW